MTGLAVKDIHDGGTQNALQKQQTTGTFEDDTPIWAMFILLPLAMEGWGGGLEGYHHLLKTILALTVGKQQVNTFPFGGVRLEGNGVVSSRCDASIGRCGSSCILARLRLPW